MTPKNKRDPNYRFGDKLRKLDFDSQRLTDRTDSLTDNISKLRCQYETAMKRIDFLESELIKLHSLISEDIAKKLN